MSPSQRANVDRLEYEGKEIFLVGTAHVSQESVDLVKEIIEEAQPHTVCVELCDSRYQALSQENRWQETNLFKAIKEKKAFLLLANLMLASFQRRIGEKLDIKPGQEMATAIDTAREKGAAIELVDRDVRTTLSRAWRFMKLSSKIKLVVELLSSFGEMDKLKKDDIENLKNKDVLEAVLAEVGESLPEVKRILIDERDEYLAHKIRSAPGKKIVAVVGAGHVPGIKKCWEKPVDMMELESIPPRGKILAGFKWGLPLLIVSLIILGFFKAGQSAGTEMITWWIAVNAAFAGMGAAMALAHPFTVCSAVVTAPFTSLNPMIAAGWVSGMVELFLRKPRVKDFEALPSDLSRIRGFWKNGITRVLLVVVMTNLGSAVGTFVAIPLMLRAFQ